MDSYENSIVSDHTAKEAWTIQNGDDIENGHTHCSVDRDGKSRTRLRERILLVKMI